MKQWAKKQTGFTIVELLIVVVVIAILATITIVAYNGIRERAIVSQVQSTLSQANKKILAYAAENADQYPASLADIGIANANGMFYQYTTSAGTYALTVTNGFPGTTQYYLSNTQQTFVEGIAPGHNLAAWNEPEVGSQAITGTGTFIETNSSNYYSAPASIRVAPGSTHLPTYNSPFIGEVGQVMTISVRIKSDAGWDGSANMSKIRIAYANSGTFITACAYSGPKPTWVYVTCPYTFSVANEPIKVTFGNDGTTGNIWLDDIHVSIQ